jgi:15-cis-phytoene synthase
MLAASWDENLLTRALEDLSGEHSATLPDHHRGEALNTAYRYCREVTAIHSKSFFMASSLLEQEQRHAIRALYAFCRTTDDIVDHPGPDCAQQLQLWRERALSSNPRANDPVPIAWADARQKFRIPSRYAHQLIDGVGCDLHVQRYPNFSELADYCYGVASTVGLMSMYIVGFANEHAIRYAVKLGVALQLTNILRDIAEDWERGRLYLPEDELREFGISEDHLNYGIVDGAWCAFMRFQIERANRIYAEAWPGIGLLHPGGRLAIAAAASFYQDILKAIEARGYDVFSGRACLSKWEKLRKLPQLWYAYGSGPRNKPFQHAR